MFDRQATFTKAFLGLAAQGFNRAGEVTTRSYNDESYFNCLYRGPNGYKCAIGHCITDEQYRTIQEGMGATSPEVCAVMGYAYQSDDSRWASRLQYVHDTGKTPMQMLEKLLLFVMEHNLTVPKYN